MKKINVFELTAKYDKRKSFYGKAQVIDYGNGFMELQSYGTIVSRVKNGKVEHLDYSASHEKSTTTSRHQREFERQFAY